MNSNDKTNNASNKTKSNPITNQTKTQTKKPKKPKTQVEKKKSITTYLSAKYSDKARRVLHTSLMSLSWFTSHGP